jgi:hypothetical protein
VEVGQGDLKPIRRGVAYKRRRLARYQRVATAKELIEKGGETKEERWRKVNINIQLGPKRSPSVEREKRAQAGSGYGA